MKTNFEYWLNFKRLTENKERILLFHSGVFYKTFDSDAEFLSTLFGFQVMEKGDHFVAGFPIQVEEKYLGQLREGGYSYQILRTISGEIALLEEFDGEMPLTYTPAKVVFWQPKKEKDPIPESSEIRFKNFLLDLEQVIHKYL